MTLVRIRYDLPTIPQPDRLGMLLAYDEDRREVWGFGGFDPVTFIGVDELWRWRVDEPGLGWVRVPVVGPRPIGRSDALWVYDSLRQNFIRTDLSATGLAARFPQMGVYDKARDRVVRFGGVDAGFIQQQDTQEFDPSGNAWANITPALPLPTARSSHSMAYDELRELTILHGGTAAGFVDLGDTWVYPIAGEWSEQLSALNPSPRRLHAMAYHPRLRGVHVSHGSSIPTAPKGTWLLQADGYREIHALAEPGDRDLVYATRVDALGAVAIHGGVDLVAPPFPVLVETQLLGRDEEWSEAALGLDYDRTEIEVDGEARLAAPATTPQALLRMDYTVQASAISGFAVVDTIPLGDKLRFAVEVDGAALWWDDSLETPAWVASSLILDEMNLEATVAANIAGLDLGDGAAVAFVAILDSDTGATTPEMAQIELDADLAVEIGAAPRMVTIRGVVEDEAGAAVAGATLTITPPAEGYYHEGRLVARSFSAKSNASGEILVQAYETESVGVQMTIALDLGTGTRTATAVIPDRSPIELSEILP
jgi:hypothetical protein